jgi:hypothetical protein
MRSFREQTQDIHSIQYDRYYTVYIDGQKIHGRYARMSQAVSKIPPKCENAYILDKNMDKVYIFHKGKLNGEIENK